MKIVVVLYPGGKAATSNPKLLGAAENALGLPAFLKGKGHKLVVLTDKEAKLDKHLPDTDVLVTTPFWPAYVTKERIAQAPNLKLVLTAGVGSDHIDLAAAAAHNITVAEITGCNVVSVAEHAVMQILALCRNFIPSYKQVLEGRWDIAEAVSRAHDLEGKTVGIVGMGRIGQRSAIRLRPFDVNLLYYDFRRLTTVEEEVLGVRYHLLDDLIPRCDAITIHCPLTPETDGLFNRDRLFAMKRGSWLVNTARGRIVDTLALVEALKKGRLGGYAGDVWYPQPAPPDHPWRTMPNHAMTPHVSGTTLEAQKRYADGIQDCLARFFAGKPLERDYLIVDGGKVVSPSYSYAFKG
ncbi:MAG: NAD-dependent formate dehydrogenase [Euryarchaeota archaeon]|nr:NAD-dependent formate dehydrogenase [Euryarchaeota archaeon]MDE1837054.1 NAD-dependent formate dehydrogenase [Euryarchaeota archaeon]MDE1880985.1 NAD-dependent formate dehydrogenase [Euryarchaeota archaeon]MDE2046380.1 NAD-dependent formate dehydrogenase [Thermoplasmata archaeon]